jgi:hypothetical protein
MFEHHWKFHIGVPLPIVDLSLTSHMRSTFPLFLRGVEQMEVGNLFYFLMTKMR